MGWETVTLLKKEQFSRCKADGEEVGLAGLGLGFGRGHLQHGYKNKLVSPSEKHLKKVWMICIKQKTHEPREKSEKHRENLAKATVHFPILCSLQNTFSDLWHLSVSQVTKMHCFPLGKPITQSNTLSWPGKVFRGFIN